jgi:phage shock protein PspC (stress-responsive transcriptional regulator)
MNKVIIINLGGNAYQVEEPGFDKIHSYLQNALLELADNPDRDEIKLDLERAIGEKMKRFLNPHKTVVSTSEIEEILKEMGPVGGEAEPAHETSVQDKIKRLYRIREGSILAGVCAGLAAYFNTDVSLVRILFILLTILTQGFGVIAYIVMAVVVPVAGSPEAIARASGKPFTAQEFVDRAKAEYTHFRARHKENKK